MAAPNLKLHEVRVVVVEAEPMDHIRKQIRDAFAAALAPLVPSALASVSVGRVHPLESADLVAASIYTETENADPGGAVLGNGAQLRALEVVVALHAAKASGASPGLLDSLDAAALEVEKAIQADATVAGLLQTLDVSQTLTELEGNAENPRGVLRLSWGCVYRVNPADPAVLA